MEHRKAENIIALVKDAQTSYLEEGVRMKVNCRTEDYRFYEKYAVDPTPFA